MSLSQCFIAIAFGSAALAALACDTNKSSETTTTGATIRPAPINNGPAPVPNDVSALAAGTEIVANPDVNAAAIERMTSARCARALTCNNVGASGKKWTNQAACERELRQTVRADFDVDSCRNVLQDRVDECVEAIESESCDELLGPSFGACLKSTICNDTP